VVDYGKIKNKSEFQLVIWQTGPGVSWSKSTVFTYSAVDEDQVLQNGAYSRICFFRDST